MRRSRQSSLPLTLRWRAEGSERLFVAKGGKCSRQREGCGSGRRERGWGALRQTGAGVQEPAESRGLWIWGSEGRWETAGV